MIDVRRFTDGHGVAGVLAELQDSAPTDLASLRLVGGDADGWAGLATAILDWAAIEAALASCPAVLVGVVRGTCRGSAARLTGSLDLLYGVNPIDAEENVDLIEVGSEEEIDRSIAALEREIDSVGPPAVVTAMLLRGGSHRSTFDGLLAEALAYSMLQSGDRFAAWKEGRHAGA